MADAELVAALKLAKDKKMFFAFIPKGTDGKLIVSKKKIAPREIAEARKEIGGSAPVTGKCYAEDGKMVFLVARPAAESLVAAVRNVARRDAGLNLHPEFREALEANEEDETTEVEVDATPQEAAPAAPDAATAPARSQASVLGLQKALQKLGFYDGELDGVMGPSTQDAVKTFQTGHGLPADGALNHATQAALAAALKGAHTTASGAQEAPVRTARPPMPTADAATQAASAAEMAVLEDRRRDFKKARAAWVAAKTKAEEDLEKVKDGAHMTYLADAEQFPKIVKGCKEIDDILDNLDDELRDTLDQYASTPLKNQTKLATLAATAKEILDRYGKYVEGNQVLKAIDHKEFADVTIYAPIKKALADLEKAL